MAGEALDVEVFTGVSTTRKDSQARDVTNLINGNTNLKNAGLSANESTIGTGTLAVGRDEYDPSVTALANGNFVVTWQSKNDDGSSAIYGQLFDTGFSTVGFTHENLAMETIDQVDRALQLVSNQRT